MTKLIAVLDDWRHVARSMADWDSLGPDVELSIFHDHLTVEERLIERLAPFHIIALMRERSPLNQAMIARLSRLELVVMTGMRNARLDLVAASQKGITVCGTPAPLQGSMMPELTWGLILALLREIPREDRAIRRGVWQETIGVGLFGKTIGIIGLGRAGARIATVALAFGMRVIAWSQNLTAERAAACGALLVTKEQLLDEANIVTVQVQLSDRTRGLIGAAELARMRPDAYLINTARGPVVDERALVEALQQHRIAGAGLDVFDIEPIPPDHPLLRLDNVVLTPHIGYVTRESLHAFYADMVEDIAAYLAGRPIRLVTPA